MMRVVTLGLGAALLVAGCGGRPPSAAECVPAVAGQDDVAYLAVVEGEVTIRRGAGGATEPARADMALSRGDTVVAGADAVVVVVLANCHVLRLAEGQETPVGKLAQLDAPPPSRGFSEMFAAALGSDDLSRIGGAERLERIAGWNARRASGETPAPVSAAPAPIAAGKEAAGGAPAEAQVAQGPGAPETAEIHEEAPAERAGANQGAPGGPGKAADEAEGVKAKKQDKGSKAPAKPRDTAADGLNLDGVGYGGGGDTPPPTRPTPKIEPAPDAEDARPAPNAGKKAPETDLVEGWILETGDKKQVPKASLPAALAAKRAALATCVAEARPGVATPVLRLRIAAGAVAEVKVDGGAVPGCVHLVGLNLGVEDGWMVVRVKR